MKAVYIREFSGPSGLEIRDVKEPQILSATDIIVNVKAAGVNRADLLQTLGKYPPPKGYPERIPGLEFAGEVSAIGDGVEMWRVGDRVFGITAGGGQAQYTTVDQSSVAQIPDGISYIDAAAYPEVFITANDAVFDQARLKKGETLLIHAIGSAVGLAALQLAKNAGAMVIGTSRTAEKLTKAAELGLDLGILADDPATISQKMLEAAGEKGADVILDLVGASYLNANLQCVANRGRIICVGMTGGSRGEIDLSILLRKRASLTGTVLRPRSILEKADAVRSFAKHVLPQITSGRLLPIIDTEFDSADVTAAYDRVASNLSFGKVVLTF